MSTPRERAVLEARSWLGTPFHVGARVKGAGVDCAGLIVGVFSAIGVLPALELPAYPGDWFLHRDDDRFLEGLRPFAREVPSPLPGDVAMFRYGRAVSHAAIVVAWPVVIHARGDIGVLLDDAERSSLLAGRLAGCWSFMGDAP